MLYKFIGYYGNLSKRNKLTIYKACERSLLTYNIQIWDDVSKSNMKKLESFQNKCLRQCLSLRPNPVTYRQITTQILHLQSNVTTLMEYATRIKEKFIDKCRRHSNELIKSLFRSLHCLNIRKIFNEIIANIFCVTNFKKKNRKKKSSFNLRRISSVFKAYFISISFRTNFFRTKFFRTNF